MPRVLITGASRGVGRALSAEYLSRGWEVVAVCRDADQAPPGTRVETLDVTDAAQVQALGRRYAEIPLDVAINNAGIFDTDPKLDDIDLTEWRRVLEVNLLAPVNVARALLPALRLGGEKKLITLTSGLGSIELNQGGNYLYRSSKAAVNMAMRCLAVDLRDEGIIVGLVSPGLVDTDMVRHIPRPKITPEASAQAVALCISGLTLKQSGLALRASGEPLPW